MSKGNDDVHSRLFEALERQAALAEILRAIAASPRDLPSLLQQVLESARKLCRADNGFIAQREGDLLRAVVTVGMEGAVKDRQLQGAAPIDRGTGIGRVILDGRPAHIHDALADPEMSAFALEMQRIVGFRTVLAFPLRRGDDVVGLVALRRNEVRPFSSSEIDLVSGFADQAAIAIEIVRSHETVERQRAELRRFLSPQIADLITSPEGPALLQGHRREITVVFCDLRGFTAFSETAEPEEALIVVRAFHATLGPLIVEHGGTLEHFEGDGAMVFFNDPIAVDDHVLRAVRMTLAMRERMDERVAGWRKRGHSLGFGSGIATGYATLGRIGFEGRYDYGAIGPVTNLAARLSSEAKAGQILISQRSFAQVEDLIDFESIGELAVKGYSRPQPAYNVLGVREPVGA